MPRLPLALLAGLLALTLAGCDGVGSDAQRAFVLAAFSPPSGIAQTDAQGRLVRDDPDDWRTAPRYGSRFLVQQRPFPNPVRATEAAVMVVFTDGGVPGGLRLFRLDARGDLRLMATEPGATQPGLYTFSFFGAEVAVGGQPGLYRLLLLDGRDDVVTYGDVQLVP